MLNHHMKVSFYKDYDFLYKYQRKSQISYLKDSKYNLNQNSLNFNFLMQYS
jgi:hypothetical protein